MNFVATNYVTQKRHKKRNWRKREDEMRKPLPSDFCVTLYSKYPIFHHEEGGYYESGIKDSDFWVGNRRSLIHFLRTDKKIKR